MYHLLSRYTGESVSDKWLFVFFPASDSSCSSSDSSEEDEDDTAFEELQRKKLHPWRLHDELWYNDPGEVLR